MIDVSLALWLVCIGAVFGGLLINWLNSVSEQSILKEIALKLEKSDFPDALSEKIDELKAHYEFEDRAEVVACSVQLLDQYKQSVAMVRQLENGIWQPVVLTGKGTK